MCKKHYARWYRKNSTRRDDSFAWHTVTLTVKVQERECEYCGKVFVPQFTKARGNGRGRPQKWVISDRRTCNDRCAGGLAGEKNWGKPRGYRVHIPDDPGSLDATSCVAEGCARDIHSRNLCRTHYSTYW